MARTKINYPQLQNEWWEEIGRTTLGVAGNSITITTLPVKKYLKIYIYASATGGTINATMRFNNDSATNYSNRSSANGAADGTGVSSTTMGMSATASTNSRFIECYVLNISAIEKLVTGHVIETTNGGPTATAARAEIANIWANTSVQISRVDIVNTGAGNFAIGSEVIVLGHD